MGTNYYWNTTLCHHCGNSQQKHIGKSSGGWVFSLRTYPEEGINDLPDWQKIWETQEGEIEDEYGRIVTIEEMLQSITERANRREWSERDTLPSGYSSWQQFHRDNNSCEGPKGLLRHAPNSNWPTTPGAGTWDCCPYEFS